MLNPTLIIDFLDRNFRSQYRLAKGGEEALINSIHVEDYKYHMSINTRTGLWQDFKSGETGNFYQLVSQVKGIPYRRAKAELTFRSIELGEINSPSPKRKVKDVALDDYRPITPEDHQVIDYLSSRGFCHPVDDKIFYARISLPKSRFAIAFKVSGKVFFYQTRSLDDQKYKPKYLNCEGISKDSILFPYDYASLSPLVITEGVFDALALQKCGVNATCTLGAPSKHQVLTLNSYPGKLILGYDDDDAGKREEGKFIRIHKKLYTTPLYRCAPPEGWNDWAKAFEKGVDLKSHVTNCLSEIDSLKDALRNLN
jgi:hypothetical protein